MESGLSPLARGNPPRGIRPHYIEGPIPARTGQPSPVPWRSAFGGAYPRSHGATGVNISDELVDYGLSPLARGNPMLGGHEKAASGPIPARTGQPPRLI